MIVRQKFEYDVVIFDSFEHLKKEIVLRASQGWRVIADMVDVPIIGNAKGNALLLERDFEPDKNRAEAAVKHAEAVATKTTTVAEQLKLAKEAKETAELAVKEAEKQAAEAEAEKKVAEEAAANATAQALGQTGEKA